MTTLQASQSVTRGDEIIAGYLIKDECCRLLRGLIRSLKRQLAGYGKTHPRYHKIRSEIDAIELEYRSCLFDMSILNRLS